MEKKLIEMVCTGNNGRSPVAELIANNYLKEVGASNEYGAISSGTLVDKIKQGNVPIKAMIPIIDIAKNKGMYDSNSLEELDDALRTEDSKLIKKYFDQAAQSLAEEEKQYRGTALKEYEIKGSVKEKKDQTIARLDTIAVLPMDKKNYASILNIYCDSEYAPLISVISSLATGNTEAEVLNAFGTDEETYKATVEQLINEVPIAIGKIIGA